MFGRRQLDACREEARVQNRDLKLLNTINGFGAKGLLRSISHRAMPPVDDRLHGEGDAPMAGVQVLTRYCGIEAPYWGLFVNHYHRIGVRRLQVCVQNDRDAEEVEAWDYPEPMTIQVQRLRSDLPPDEGLRELDPSSYRHDAPFTLLADCDEYLQPLRSDLSIRRLFELFPERAQCSIPWVMCPVLNPLQEQPRGFWGNHGKPIARSDQIEAVASDHHFQVPPVKPGGRILSTPMASMGWVLVHCLSRSFEDTLLRQLHTRFTCVKNTDRGEIVSRVRSGDLPIRLRVLAYFSLQERYLDVPVPSLRAIDLAAQTRLLQSCLGESDLRLAREVFEEYRRLLGRCVRRLPTYPATTFPDIVAALPSPDELRQLYDA
ncbi:hypothetical protein SynMEDNS5_00184 [Synechococcus sp. MEDNS5]|uniref:hypothetical protein n=1 Tax=Synechococcus sp. MEDNS5 TaxID=1442554 RepID=UPI0016452450|nr:hypothetical protein [Synechococcus sp. MEDNS5]QNJ04947.1 hypothetical protein SynMEDNS5_00184 [Synechococcus sp. MEDNS5]